MGWRKRLNSCPAYSWEPPFKRSVLWRPHHISHSLLCCLCADESGPCYLRLWTRGGFFSGSPDGETSRLNVLFSPEECEQFFKGPGLPAPFLHPHCSGEGLHPNGPHFHSNYDNKQKASRLIAVKLVMKLIGELVFVPPMRIYLPNHTADRCWAHTCFREGELSETSLPATRWKELQPTHSYVQTYTYSVPLKPTLNM